jgi:hypothetical protein
MNSQTRWARMVRQLEPSRVYRMTISTFMSDEDRHELNEYEIHYKTRRKGKLRTVRRYLLKRCIKHFQRAVYHLTRKWIPLKRIRVNFERETPAHEEDDNIQTEARRMTKKKMRWEAEPFKTRTLNYSTTKSSTRKMLVSRLRRAFVRR